MKKPMVRRGSRRDAEAFLGLLAELAAFEKLEPPDAQAKRRIAMDVFDRKRLGLFLASVGNRIVGYALYFYSYSSFLGRPTLYLEDIFVVEGSRGSGIGEDLFRRCAKEALAEGCGRMEWSVLKWNTSAIAFYEKMGAERLDGWQVYRLGAGRLRSIAGEGGAKSR